MAEVKEMDTVTAYIKVASHEARKGEFKKVLLLYSGGLDTSVMLKWIQEQYECQVVTLTVDIGQTADNLEEIRAKAIKLGAVHAEVVDAKDEFADILLAEAIMANADYQGGYALGCPLGRVMISKIAVRVAEKYDCQVIAHGCTGKGNDQVRFEGYITTLNPKLKMIAPVREWAMGRDEELAYAEKHGIQVKQKKDTPYSYDENQWSNTAEGGEIEDPELAPRMEKILLWCKTPEKAPDVKTTLTIGFKAGIPVSLNGKEMKLSKIIADLNTIGGENAVGVFPLIEDRLIGLKVRGVYENPAATILIKAHQNLEQLVSTREENEMKRFIDTKWAYLTYAAKWYEPVMYHIHAYIVSQNKKVSGEVTVSLYKGHVEVLSLKSPHSLFDKTLATFDADPTFNSNSSAGFIELYTLAQRTSFQAYSYEDNLYKN